MASKVKKDRNGQPRDEKGYLAKGNTNNPKGRGGAIGEKSLIALAAHNFAQKNPGIAASSQEVRALIAEGKIARALGSKDERVRLAESTYIIDQLEGKAVQRNVNMEVDSDDEIFFNNALERAQKSTSQNKK